MLLEKRYQPNEISPHLPRKLGGSDFAGFAAPTSNTTYTPNQFFDVCLPSSSRGCIRIVGYLIRKTLGWCDSLGNPQREQIEVSYREFERNAGVGHQMIRDSLDEAVKNNFIERIRIGRARAANDAGETALYALKWDSTPRYARTLEDFRGFFEGEGNRTDIPNDFFDKVIPVETLSVINVVGAVIRYSIGFQGKHGARRQHATLAYSSILKISGLSSRRTVAEAIRTALAKHYIVRLDAGYFSADVSKRRTATYAIYWSDGFHAKNAPKRIPEGLGITHSEKDTSKQHARSEKDTSIAPKRIPAVHSEKDTIEIKQLNERQKQERSAAELLKKAGFDTRAANSLVRKHPLEVILRQSEWLADRHATINAPGLLLRAIEGDWPAPIKLHARLERHPGLPDDNPEEPSQEPLRQNYLEWLKEQETHYRERYPQDYARFLAKRARRRADLEEERSWMLRDFHLSRHDSEPRRLFEFQQYMALPNFQSWSSTINNSSTN